MTTAEKIELALIPACGVVGWWLAGRFSGPFGIGALLLGASVLLLLQGLVRDLWLISRQPVQPAGARREALCMCVESTVGATGVLLGLLVLGSAFDATFPASPLAIGVLTMAVLAIGFVIKDFIVVLRPFGIRREKDHLSIVFSWKRQAGHGNGVGVE